MDLLAALNWRYAVKVFDSSKKIEASAWGKLEQSLILTPSSYGLQPWKFLVVTDQETKKKLTALSWNQKQVESCSHYVIFAAMEKMTEEHIDAHIRRMVEIRGHTVEHYEKFRKGAVADTIHGARSKWVSEWLARQCYIALGNFMTSAAILGVDTCPMEGFDPAKYDEALGLIGTGFRTIVACAAGYRSPEDKYGHAEKVRFPRTKLIQEI